MTTRTTYVPQHSIIVARDGKQIDALAEYERTGKAFKFTADEVKDIEAASGGNLDASLRAPTNETHDEDEGTPGEPASSNEPTPGTTPAEKAAAKKAAADKAAADKAAADKAAADKAAADKDNDL